ncbi:MAG: CYTH domain-containing protein [Patescibacteria group bacterium]
MQYEVEIKSLLGSAENAQSLRERMKIIDPHFALTSRNRQLNHYFTGIGTLGGIYLAFESYFSEQAKKQLRYLKAHANNFSLRTRGKDEEMLLVIKASIDSTSSQNGITRIEFEEKINLPLEEIDEILLSIGFEYQAKWSREREEYVCKGVSVCLDRNAGYGWLAEFEKMVGSEHELENARSEVRALMDLCGVQELQQDRLERMFAFYNAHWPEYYGTEKVFTIA